MPTADGRALLPAEVVGFDDLRDAASTDNARAKERRLESLRESQWMSEVGREGAARTMLDAAFDELEVRR